MARLPQELRVVLCKGFPLLALLLMVGCSTDAKPDEPKVAKASPTAAPNPPTATTDAKAATDPLSARLDALIADTERKEKEYRDVERTTTSQNTVAAARQMAAALQPPPSGGAPALASGGAQTPVAAAAMSPPAESVRGVLKDEDWWRSNALRLQRQRDADTRALTAAQLHFDALPDQAKGALGVPVVDAWMKARAEISRLTAVVATDVQAVKDFEEEARRAGIAPGWLREK